MRAFAAVLESKMPPSNEQAGSNAKVAKRKICVFMIIEAQLTDTEVFQVLALGGVGFPGALEFG